MRGKILAIFLFGMLLSLPLYAQTASKAGSLSGAELNGKGMFQQRCSICHTAPVPGRKAFGPVLTAAGVIGKEDIVRIFIQRGTPRMPGFQYGLEPNEIEDIIAYLKTVKETESKVQPGAGAAAEQQRD